MVLALGGHGISPPNDVSYASERARIRALGPLMAGLASYYRMLVVHGNGPQVARLLSTDEDIGDLDSHTAQTKGELGYLLSQILPAPSVSVATRVLVDREPGPPVKPIGPVLAAEPSLPSKRVSGGWRVLVPSPRPSAVVEEEAIARLLTTHHVVGGGGGGVPIGADGSPLEAVIDKDWVALMLAMALGAQTLVLATDVAGVFPALDEAGAKVIAHLSVAAAEGLLAQGLDPGSMAPKVASAMEFAQTTGRGAVICAVEQIREALAGRAGTRVSSR